MAKKQRKHNRQKEQPKKTSTISSTELEDKIHRNLEKFIYRPAIKYAKELHQREPDKYLPLLIKALRGLYQELSEKKQMARAKAVLDQIIALGDPATSDLMELALALQSGEILPRHEKIAHLKIPSLLNHDFAEADKNIVIDVLIAASEFSSQPQFESQTNSFSEQIYADILAVREAFELVCEKQYANAQEKISGIKRKSLLAPWRLLLKGIISFYLGEDEKALTALKKLPDETTPTKIAEAYLFLLNESETRQTYEKKHSFLQKVVLLATSDNLEDLLPRAEVLWKTGRYRDSFIHIKPLLYTITPESSSLPRRLFRFYFNSIFTMVSEQSSNYLEQLHQEIFRSKKESPPLLNTEFLRITALYQEINHFPIEETAEVWDLFLQSHNREQPENPALTAAIYAYEADLFAQTDSFSENDALSRLQKMVAAFDNFDGFDEFDEYDEEESEPLDFERAEELYEKAIKSDPDNFVIRLKLLQLYESSGSEEASKTNRLLDELIHRFPDNKEILLRAGTRCLERKAFPKGLKYLRQAAQLDRSDNKIKETIIIGSILYAWKLSSAGNDKKYRTIFAETLNFCTTGLQNLTLSPATLRARWAVIELGNDNFDESQQQLSLARAADKSLHPDEVLYFFYLYANISGLPKTKLKDYEKQMKRDLKSYTDFDKIITCSKILLYNILVSDEEESFIEQEIQRLNKIFNRLLKSKQSLTPDQCLDIINFARNPYNNNEKLALSYARRTRLEFPNDLKFWLTKLVVELEYARPIPSNAKMNELDKLIKAAEAVNNQELVQHAKNVAETYREQIGWYNRYHRLYDNEDDEYEDYEDEDTPLIPLPPGVSKPPKNWPRQ
ncbi:MAG: tetratricopeptide repeat protein [Deltaproteobacteria bacterium]|nr:tetratricopeptide repeat protein [Candidatus Tharpella sp.]